MRAIRSLGATVVGAAALLNLGGCTTPSDQALAALGHTTYSGPLMGYHELIDTIPIDNDGGHPLRLERVALTAPHNVRVTKAVVVPVDERHGIEGVLRWPQAAENDVSFDVLQTAETAARFVLPPHSRSRWALSLILEQPDRTESMSATGITVAYTVDGTDRSLDMTQGFCFSTPADVAACP